MVRTANTRSCCPRTPSGIEPVRSQWAAGEAVQFRPHTPDDRLHGWVVGKVPLLLGIVTKAKQGFDNVAFAAHVRPLVLGQGGKWPSGRTQPVPGVFVAVAEGGLLRKAPGWMSRSRGRPAAVGRPRAVPATPRETESRPEGP